MSHGPSETDVLGDPIDYSESLGHCVVHGAIVDHLEFQSFLEKYPDNPITGVKFPAGLDIQGISKIEI